MPVNFDFCDIEETSRVVQELASPSDGNCEQVLFLHKLEPPNDAEKDMSTSAPGNTEFGLLRRIRVQPLEVRFS